MNSSSIKELDELSKSLESISHKVRPLRSGNDLKEGVQLSIELYNISTRLKKIARSLEDDGK